MCVTVLRTPYWYSVLCSRSRSASLYVSLLHVFSDKPQNNLKMQRTVLRTPQPLPLSRLALCLHGPRLEIFSMAGNRLVPTGRDAEIETGAFGPPSRSSNRKCVLASWILRVPFLRHALPDRIGVDDVHTQCGCNS